MRDYGVFMKARTQDKASATGAILVWALTVGCSPSTDRDVNVEPVPTTPVTPIPSETASATPAPTPAPTASASNKPPSGLALGQGRYRSEPCGARKYVREVVIGSEQQVTVEDRVSPCPKGTACVWSGIVVRKGTYAVDKPESMGKPFQLRLTLGKPSSDAGVAPPGHFEWYASRGDLAEPGDTCHYQKVP